MTSDPEPGWCACGLPLHYTSMQAREYVDALIAALGPTLLITVGQQTFRVPRHYIALHGIRAQELPTLGFAEVPTVD
jgi:hypothetical protein